MKSSCESLNPACPDLSGKILIQIVFESQSPHQHKHPCNPLIRLIHDSDNYRPSEAMLVH